MNSAKLGSVGLQVERLDQRDVPAAVVADFGGSGVWRWTAPGGWSQLTGANPDANGLVVAIDGTTVVADFGDSGGLWRWTQAAGWSQLSGVNAEAVVANDNGDVFADFGAGGGLWRWSPQSGWTQFSGFNPEDIACNTTLGGASVLAADLGMAGLWRWTAANGWVKLSTVNTEDVTVNGNGEVYADFGQLGGLWWWKITNGTGSWKQISSANPDGISAAYAMVYVDFGGSGLWWMSEFGWYQFSTANAEQISAGLFGYFGDVAVGADLGGSGLWLNRPNIGWSQLTPANPEQIWVG